MVKDFASSLEPRKVNHLGKKLFVINDFANSYSIDGLNQKLYLSRLRMPSCSDMLLLLDASMRENKGVDKSLFQERMFVTKTTIEYGPKGIRKRHDWLPQFGGWKNYEAGSFEVTEENLDEYILACKDNALLDIVTKKNTSLLSRLPHLVSTIGGIAVKSLPLKENGGFEEAFRAVEVGIVDNLLTIDARGIIGASDLYTLGLK